MTLPHKQIWCKPGYDSWDQYGHWYRDGAGGGTEYTRADIADALTAEVAALKAENERLRDALEWYAEQGQISQKVTIDATWAKERIHRDKGKIAREALKGGEQ